MTSWLSFCSYDILFSLLLFIFTENTFNNLKQLFLGKSLESLELEAQNIEAMEVYLKK